MFPNIFMFVLFQSLSIRRRIEAKSCRSSYNIQGYRGARLGIGQGVVMVMEVITTGGGNCVKLVIGQRMAELSAGCSKCIVKAVIWIVHLIDLEHSFQTSFIEAGIVGNEGNGSYLVVEIIDCLLVREKHVGDAFLQFFPYF